MADMESMRCPSCTRPVPVGQRFCGECGYDSGPDATPTQTSISVEPDSGGTPASPTLKGTPSFASVGRVTTGDSVSVSRFVPGEMLAGRYRIVGQLGKGGMGEVFRADDLKLGQPVAMKFLPPELERNENRLKRFLNEVRVARQVSHPNVCRVYDIGEVGDQHFLSMEFVDGEDLASLLRRIGRLSDEKAVQISRQICAGLAAAHAKGIVHRDLKPANVMIDGSGQVRITDFGLAGLAEGFHGAEIRVGTPAYMAPEQIRGEEVTVKSDIYSLGLLLYELFTGKTAFEAPTLAELGRKQTEAMPDNPSTLVDGFDPAIERVILRCIEKDPALRPDSALAVAAALPGGDPLAAALAAGETPSPEMVAAAGQTGGLHPGIGAACMSLIVLGIVGLVALSGQWSMPRHFALGKPPQALAVEAAETIERLAPDTAVADRVFAFGLDDDYMNHVRENDDSPGRWDSLGTVRPSPLVFWYRQSPRPLVAERAAGPVSYSNPGMRRSGMTRVQLDEHGRLIDFLAVPPQHDPSPEPAAEPDWTALFEEADLDPTVFERTDPEWNPLVDCDSRAAWEGHPDGQAEHRLRIEAGAYRGRPVYFRVLAPWTEPERMQAGSGDTSSRVAGIILISLIVIIILLGAFIARRNVRMGRGDMKGALRMASYMFVVTLAAWSLAVHHVGSLAEVIMLGRAVQVALFTAGIVWVLYVALEPYLRRLWPHVLISWNRLLAGRLRDPLVGRDLLFGSLAGVSIAFLVVLSQLVPTWVGRASLSPVENPVNNLATVRSSISALLALQANAILVPIALLFLILLVRVVVRKTWAAVSVVALMMTAVQGMQGPDTPLFWLISGLIWCILIAVITRLGVLASMFSFVYANTLLGLPLTTEFSAWYSGRAWAGLLLAAALAAYGFYISLGDRPAFGRTLFPD